MKMYFAFFILMLATASCRSFPAFEEYQELDGEEWDYNRVLEFHARIPDSGRYCVTLCVRHTTRFELTNLWCIIDTRSSADNQLHDTVNVKIATPTGRWFGEGKLLKTIEQPINKNPVTLPKGDVLFRIRQGLHLENLKGVKNIGIRIEKTNEHTKPSYQQWQKTN